MPCIIQLITDKGENVETLAKKTYATTTNYSNGYQQLTKTIYDAALSFAENSDIHVGSTVWVIDSRFANDVKWCKGVVEEIRSLHDNNSYMSYRPEYSGKAAFMRAVIFGIKKESQYGSQWLTPACLLDMSTTAPEGWEEPKLHLAYGGPTC